MQQPEFEKIANSTWVKAYIHIDGMTRSEPADYEQRLNAGDQWFIKIVQTVFAAECGLYKDNVVPQQFTTLMKLYRNEVSSHVEIDNPLAIVQLQQIPLYHFGIGRSMLLIGSLLDHQIIRYDQARQIIQELMQVTHIGLEIEDYLLSCHVLDDVDSSETDQAIEEALTVHAQAVKEFKSGKEKALGTIIGFVMKKVKGDPKAINQQIRDRIAAMEI